MKKYHEMKTPEGTLEFEAITDYDVVIQIEVSLDGKKLGTIFTENGEHDWNLILNGANPIEEGWENGAGQDLSYEGWECC